MSHAFAADTALGPTNAFGPRADAYVTSAVHASGADLDQVAALAQRHAVGRALDLGCGGGHVSYRLALHAGSVVACDPSPQMLAAVARTADARGLANITTEAATAEHLPFEAASFDLLACRFTVHHWHDAPAGLHEARRVLKPGAEAVFIDAIAPWHPVLDTHLQTVEVLRDPSHVRDYSLAEWTDFLARAGFVLRAVTPRRLRMDFADWTARTATPPAHVQAIRSLQDGAAPLVRQHFAIERDGSFLLDTVTLEVAAA